MLAGKQRTEGIMFVVVISDGDIFLDLKVFGKMSDARAFAEGRVQAGDAAKVYGVPQAHSLQAAKAAVEIGGGELLLALVPKPRGYDTEARGQRTPRVRRLKGWVRPINIKL